MARELLSDEKWAAIEAMLPGKSSDSGVAAADNRRFNEALSWIARTGAPWRDWLLALPSTESLFNCDNALTTTALPFRIAEQFWPR